MRFTRKGEGDRRLRCERFMKKVKFGVWKRGVMHNESDDDDEEEEEEGVGKKERKGTRKGRKRGKMKGRWKGKRTEIHDQLCSKHLKFEPRLCVTARLDDVIIYSFI